VLIGGGAVCLELGFDWIGQDLWGSDTAYFEAMAISFGAPLLMAIGIAIIGALLFVLARSWRPHAGDRS
jgi:hypothetical protein